MDGLEGQEIALVDLDNRAGVLLQLLDVDAGAEAAPLGPDQHAAHILALAQFGDDLRQLHPHRAGKGVHGRMIENDLGDAVADTCVERHV